MLKFETLYKEGHEEVVFFSDPSCNLKVIIAIHNTILGPALGGILGEYNSRAPFFLSAGLTGVNFLFGYFFLPETVTEKNRRAFSLDSINPFSTIWKTFSFGVLRSALVCYFIISVAHWVYPAVWSYWAKEVFDWSSGMIGSSSLS